MARQLSKTARAATLLLSTAVLLLTGCGGGEPSTVQEHLLTNLAGTWVTCPDSPDSVFCATLEFDSNGTLRETGDEEDYVIDETRPWSARAITETSALVTLGESNLFDLEVRVISIEDDVLRGFGGTSFHRRSEAGTVRDVAEVEGPDLAELAGTWHRSTLTPIDNKPTELTLNPDGSFVAMYESRRCEGYWSFYSADYDYAERFVRATTRLHAEEQCTDININGQTLRLRNSAEGLEVDGIVYTSEPTSTLTFSQYNVNVRLEGPIQRGEQTTVTIQFTGTEPDSMFVSLDGGPEMVVDGPFTELSEQSWETNVFIEMPNADTTFVLAGVRNDDGWASNAQASILLGQ